MSLEGLKQELQRCYSARDFDDFITVNKEEERLVNARYALVTQRLTDVSIVKYCDDTDIELILKALCPSHWAYILHGDESEGVKHYHLLLRFDNARSSGNILKVCDKFGENTLIQRCDSLGDTYDYLLHTDEKSVKAGKHPYHEEERIDDDHEYWHNLPRKTTQKVDTILQAFTEYMNGEKAYNLARKYGRDFILHFNAISALSNYIKENENECLQ